MDPTPKHTSRRTFLSMLAMAPLASSALSACGSSGPSAAGGGSGDAPSKGDITWWYLSGQPNQGIQTTSVKRWNKAHPKETIGITFFQNDAYKTKIRTAIGAGQAPTIIYGWGGGILAGYAKANQVMDLTAWLSSNPDVKNNVLPSSYGPATVNGKIYAYPNENASPIIMFYNKDLFAKHNVQPPKTWDDLLTLVDVFNKAGVAPLSLGGQSRWTSMMWLEYLFDRVGGPQVFNDIYAGKPNAWSNPDAMTALTMVQDLVKKKGFIKGFESITADSNADWAVLYTGKAAMMLHGSWSYGGIKASQPTFVKSSMGWGVFPTVDGGKGDPKDITGNPGQYTSIYAKATPEQVTAAKDFFAKGIMDDDVVKAYIDTGQVCIAANAPKYIAASEDKDFLSFAYGMVQKAPSFQQSWDQALSAATAETLLSNIDQLFSLAITPKQFASNMNATLAK
ncbi:MAG TPA: extracellular solute-binding protein [Nocardioidaceae bacterium]|nr:extracellular solute-binding protein [Nocardioidaceae bacterium]